MIDLFVYFPAWQIIGTVFIAGFIGAAGGTLWHGIYNFIVNKFKKLKKR